MGHLLLRCRSRKRNRPLHVRLLGKRQLQSKLPDHRILGREDAWRSQATAGTLLKLSKSVGDSFENPKPAPGHRGCCFSDKVRKNSTLDWAIKNIRSEVYAFRPDACVCVAVVSIESLGKHGITNEAFFV